MTLQKLFICFSPAVVPDLALRTEEIKAILSLVSGHLGFSLTLSFEHMFENVLSPVSEPSSSLLPTWRI